MKNLCQILQFRPCFHSSKGEESLKARIKLNHTRHNIAKVLTWLADNNNNTDNDNDNNNNSLYTGSSLHKE